MAVFHVAPDDAGTSRKYAALRVGVKFHNLALIDEREIDGHMAKMRLICSSASLPVATSRTLFCAVFHSFRPYFATKFASLIRKFGSKFTALKFEVFCALKFAAELKFAPSFLSALAGARLNLTGRNLPPLPQNLTLRRPSRDDPAIGRRLKSAKLKAFNFVRSSNLPNFWRTAASERLNLRRFEPAASLQISPPSLNSSPKWR